MWNLVIYVRGFGQGRGSYSFESLGLLGCRAGVDGNCCRGASYGARRTTGS